MTRRFCDGFQRRDVLRVGSAGIFGLPWTLDALLAAEARKGKPAGPPAKAQSLIFLFLQGGLSTIDTWDTKPDAPSEFAGEFQPIDTCVPGIQIGEHTPKIAATAMDKFSLIRSFNQRSSD